MRKITGFQRLLRRAGLFGAPLAAALWLALGGSGMAHDAHVVLGLAIWMALWWMTEAVPLAATALLPLVVLPLFTSIGFGAASAPYANSIVFLFMGGFMLGLALQRCGLHRRIALAMLVTVGSGQRRLVGGFMLVTALLSMWLSNTATMMMLAPIGISVLQTCREQRAGADDDATGAFGAALILGIAYAASIGGMGTPIGTPPNLIMSGYLRTHYGIDLTMLEWMRVGVPVILLLLPLTWLWLCFGAFRLPAAGFAGGEAELRAQRARLGAASGAEKRTGAVFLLVALGWVLRPQLVAWSGLAGLDDGVIALIGALLLFVLPAQGAGRRAPARLEHGARHSLGHPAAVRRRSQPGRGGDGLGRRCADRAVGVGARVRAGRADRGRARRRDRVHRGADQQYRGRHRDHAGARGAGQRARHRALAAVHGRHAGGQLRLHAAGGDAAERDCLRHGLRATAGDAARGFRPEPDRDRGGGRFRVVPGLLKEIL